MKFFRKRYPRALKFSLSPQCRSMNSKRSCLMCPRMHLAGPNYSGPDFLKRESEHSLCIRRFMIYAGPKACSRAATKRYAANSLKRKPLIGQSCHDKSTESVLLADLAATPPVYRSGEWLEKFQPHTGQLKPAWDDPAPAYSIGKEFTSATTWGW